MPLPSAHQCLELPTGLGPSLSPGSGAGERCWPARTPRWLQRGQCVSLRHEHPSSCQSLSEGTDPETLPPSWGVLDLGLSSNNHNRFTGDEFDLGFGEFQKHVWNSTHHSILQTGTFLPDSEFKTNWVFLIFNSKAFTRRLSSSVWESLKRCY